MKRCTEGNRLIRRKAQKGVILVPCLLLLSLISLISLGYLKTTGTEIKTSEVLDKKYKAKLAAESARVLALGRLSADLNYTGDTNVTLPGSNDTLDITVTAPSSQERVISVTGFSDKSMAQIETEMSLYPYHFDYTVVAYERLILKDDSIVLGNAFAASHFIGADNGKVVGDVHLCGTRSILADINGDIIQMDGFVVPVVTGNVVTDLEPIYPPSISFTSLQSLAVTDGMIINTNTVIQNQDLTGVILIRGGVDVEFENVTVHGMIVVYPMNPDAAGLFSGSIQVLNKQVTVEGLSEKYSADTDPESMLTVKTGSYLKVIADPGLVEDLAILAPSTTLKVSDGALLDVLGTVMIGFGAFKPGSHSVVTGTTITYGKLKCEGDNLFQAPESTRDAPLVPVEFRDLAISETSYSDQ